LPRHAWPADVEREFSRWAKWATDEMVPGRDAKWRKRPSSLITYAGHFSVYFGYLRHHLHIDPIQFDHLFDVALIEQFGMWQLNEKWHRVTNAAKHLVVTVKAMSRQYCLNPTVVEALSALQKRMPKSRPVYQKSDAWVPLSELERVGIALWPKHGLGRRYP